MKKHTLSALVLVLALLSRVHETSLARADEQPASPSTSDSADTSEKAASPAGRRIAIVICGHPGDAEHVALFEGTLDRIRSGLTANYQFQPEDIHMFWGDEPEETANSEETGKPAEQSEAEPSSSSETAGISASGKPSSAAHPATKAVFSAQLQEIKNSMTPDDTLLVIVIGHTYFENTRAWLNLHGPDLDQKEFASMFEGASAKQQTFIITNPCSGYYIRPLSGECRVIITATEADLEVNETLCPHVLGDMFSSAPKTEWDLDSDKQLSLFEFYIAMCRGVADRYIEETLISTEHGQLDDNADGKGSELQLHYLTEEQGGLPKNRQRPQLIEGRDGMNASKIIMGSL